MLGLRDRGEILRPHLAPRIPPVHNSFAKGDVMIDWNKVTERKLEANRRNAQKSTGPNTPEGKERSKYNHTSHGFFCAQLVLPGECYEDFEYLREALIDDFRPQNHAELLLVDRIAIASWKLRRMQRAEEQVHHVVEQTRRDHAKAYTEFYETRVQNFFAEKKIKETLRMKEMARLSREVLEADKGDRGDIATSLACEFLAAGACGAGRSEGSFERVARYEQRLENSIHRAINQLRNMRKGKNVDDLPPSPYSAKQMDSVEERYEEFCDRVERESGQRPPPFCVIDGATELPPGYGRSNRRDAMPENAPPCAVGEAKMRNEPTVAPPEPPDDDPIAQDRA